MTPASTRGEWRSHPRFAKVYERASPRTLAHGGAKRRTQLLAGLRGTVLEVGAGNGLNFAYYPSTVDRVLAVEPEPTLRDAAHDNAARAQVPIDIVDGVAERLPVENGGVDAAVVSLVLCSVVDQPAAVAELFRVIRPGGELRLFEHIQAETRGKLRAQRIADATVWPRFAGGCHTARDTLGTIEAAGFEIESRERFDFPDIWLWMPATPHVVGVARRPNP